MNDYAAQNARSLLDDSYSKQSAAGAQIASALNRPEPPRTAMSVLGTILDQTQKLISISNELAVRINGAIPEKGEACGELRADPMSNLNAAVSEIQQNINRAEQNLARALNGL